MMSDYCSLIHCYASEMKTEITKKTECKSYYMGTCWCLFKVLEACLTNASQGRVYKDTLKAKKNKKYIYISQLQAIQLKLFSYFLTCSIFLAFRALVNYRLLTNSFGDLFYPVKSEQRP